MKYEFSLHTNSEAQARTKTSLIWAEQIEGRKHGWLAIQKVLRRGFRLLKNWLKDAASYRYLTADKVAQRPKAELVDRIETVV